MKLISSIRIDGFRSIKHASLDTIGDFTCFAGLNNAGKSNVLRALNAFFTGETDPGQMLNVDSDYYRPDLRRRRKQKRIEVSITFSLPPEFKFRKGLEAVESLLGATFTISKEWTRGALHATYRLNGQELDLDQRQKIDYFLQLINFRYIPNRVLPIDVIRREHQSLRDVLIRRLGGKARSNERAFDAIRKTSDNVISGLAKRVKSISPESGDVRLATPTSWSDLAFALGYRMVQGDVEIDDTAQGSGLQSLLMMETLYLIDLDYFQQFGWKQASIWAFEEPESSLHLSLQAQVASYLASISSSSRLQVLCTTHSEMMMQYSTAQVFASRANGESVFSSPANVRAALDQIAKVGVSHWVHPILYHPLDPLIIVEGKFDCVFFEAVARLLPPTRPVQITFLERLSNSGGQTGGDKNTLQYIKQNVAAIKSRPKDAPVVVVIDWDSSQDKNAYDKLFAPDDPFVALVWPEAQCNPKFSKTMRGIERFYSDRLIEEAEKNGCKVFRDSDGVCMIEPSQKDNFKQKVGAVVESELCLKDLMYSRSFVEKVFAGAGAPLLKTLESTAMPHHSIAAGPKPPTKPNTVVGLGASASN